MTRPEILDQPSREQIGRTLKELRQRQGLTQKQVGEAVEMDPNMLSAYEQALIKLSPERALLLLRHLGDSGPEVTGLMAAIPPLAQEATVQALITQAASEGYGLFKHGIGTRIAIESGMDEQAVRRRIRDARKQLMQERERQIG